MTTKWTKGPWNYENILKILRVGPDRYANHIDDEANAQLIASAPVLYEALDTLVDAIALEGEIPHYNTVIKDCINLAQAALAAAKGE